MAREFKPVRFFVLMALVTFITCGTTAFFTHRAAHGRTSEERAGYAIGKTAGETAAPEATLPRDAALNMMAQEAFKRRGTGEPMVWKSGFEHGYEEGFKKTHPASRIP